MTLHATEYEKQKINKMVTEIAKMSLSEWQSFKKLFKYKGLRAVEIHINTSIKYSSHYVEFFSYDTVDKFWADLYKFRHLKAFL